MPGRTGDVLRLDGPLPEEVRDWTDVLRDVFLSCDMYVEDMGIRLVASICGFFPALFAVILGLDGRDGGIDFGGS